MCSDLSYKTAWLYPFQFDVRVRDKDTHPHLVLKAPLEIKS